MTVAWTSVINGLGAEGLDVTYFNYPPVGLGFDPVGVMNHHTASATREDAPSLWVVQHGRPDLRGPLCNFLVGRSGHIFAITSGRANHAGMGHQVVLDSVRLGRPTPYVNGRDTVGGNSLFYGIEVENDGVGEPYPPVQLDAVVRLNAVLCRLHGWNQYHCIHHRMWTDRKIDMSYYGDLWTPIGLRILGGGNAVPLLPPYDPGQPALVVYSGSPEEAYIKAYLGGATKVYEGQELKHYQIITIPRDHSILPNPLPPHSVGMGTHVPGWGQIAGVDRYDTLRQMNAFLGLDAES